MPSYTERLRAAQNQERIRQAFQRRDSTPETLAYGRMLSAFENDATISHGRFKSFAPDTDKELLRQYPFLAPAIHAEQEAFAGARKGGDT